MPLEQLISCAFPSPKVVDEDLRALGRGKQMSSVGKLDLGASLDADLFERDQSIAKHIQHLDFVLQGDNNVEPGRVEGHSKALFGLVRLVVKGFISIVPDSN